MKKEIGILIGRGKNCSCVDCPVLYGGTCPTTPINNKLDNAKNIHWAKARQNLKQVATKYPHLILDVIDSAYLAGLEATKK